MKFTTSTPVGTEGYNISYSDEQKCADTLKKVWPKWEVHFDWAQILFSDVQYQIDEDENTVKVQYNQSLNYWWPQVLKGIKEGMKEATAAKR